MDDFACCFLPVIILIVIVVVSYPIAKEQEKQKKHAQKLFDEMSDIFSKVRKNGVTKSDNDRFFDLSDEFLSITSKSTTLQCQFSKSIEEIDKMSNQLSLLRAAGSPSASLGEEIDKLAALRQNGMISDLEFKAFSEQFKLSTGEKASGIIDAISKLSEQRKQGAMGEGNYHAALWSLLDKLDRKT